MSQLDEAGKLPAHGLEAVLATPIMLEAIMRIRESRSKS